MAIVIDTTFQSLETCSNFVHSTIVAIATGRITLWCFQISILTPLSDEGRKVTIVWVKGNAMEAISSVGNCPPCIGRNTLSRFIWRFHGVNFSNTMLVQGREINGSPWSSIGFPCDNHSMAPIRRFPIRHLFHHHPRGPSGQPILNKI